MAEILRNRAAWDAYCNNGRASLAKWLPPSYPCAVVVSWATPAFFTVDDARTLVALATGPEPTEQERLREIRKGHGGSCDDCKCPTCEASRRLDAE